MSDLVSWSFSTRLASQAKDRGTGDLILVEGGHSSVIPSELIRRITDPTQESDSLILLVILLTCQVLLLRDSDGPSVIQVHIYFH